MSVNKLIDFCTLIFNNSNDLKSSSLNTNSKYTNSIIGDFIESGYNIDEFESTDKNKKKNYYLLGAENYKEGEDYDVTYEPSVKMESVPKRTPVKKTPSQKINASNSVKNNIKSKNLKDEKTTQAVVSFKPNKNIKIEPQKIYTISAGDNLSLIAEKYNIPLYLLKKANADIKNFRSLNVGQKIKIPSYPKLKLETINNMNDVANATGVSKNYITDILIGIEGRKSEPELKGYYDNVKDNEHPKGYLTIGFGHTGKVRGKKLTLDTKINRKEAFELLAQDLLNAKIVAAQYYGDNFNKAPQSIQCAIIDIVFNKGIEGLEKEGSLTRNLKQDLAKHDYASAAAHVIYKTDLKGLQKRNIFRFFTAVKDLSVRDKLKAFNLTQRYYENVINAYNDTISEKNFIVKAYKKAKTGK